MLLFKAFVADCGYVFVAFVCDNTFGIVVKDFFGFFDVLLNVVKDIFVKTFPNFFVTLEYFNGVPPLLGFGQMVNRRFFNVGNGMLYFP